MDSILLVVLIFLVVIFLGSIVDELKCIRKILAASARLMCEQAKHAQEIEKKEAEKKNK